MTMSDDAEPRIDWAWIDGLYKLVDRTADGPPILVCRRCGRETSWLTRHARERHGDDVAVIQPVRRAGNVKRSEKW